MKREGGIPRGAAGISAHSGQLNRGDVCGHGATGGRGAEGVLKDTIMCVFEGVCLRTGQYVAAAISCH